MDAVDIEPLYRSGDRIVVSSRSGDPLAQHYEGATGAVVACFADGERFGCEVLLDDERLVELSERDLLPDV